MERLNNLFLMIQFTIDNSLTNELAGRGLH
jgi:hypothetical protein